MKFSKSYNERLFQKGIRAKYHLARFYWLKKKVQELQCPTRKVIELGCHDGKTVDYLPQKPTLYHGYDADWEDGLNIGRRKWANDKHVELFKCTIPEQLNPRNLRYDISICMETLEHIPPDLQGPYLAKLAACTQSYCFITVPNERGLVFLTKWITKKLTGSLEEPFSWLDVTYSTLGKMDKVNRNPYGHRGFDYKQLIDTVSEHFYVDRVEGIPWTKMPPPFNLSIGIIARPKK